MPYIDVIDQELRKRALQKPDQFEEGLRRGSQLGMDIVKSDIESQREFEKMQKQSELLRAAEEEKFNRQAALDVQLQGIKGNQLRVLGPYSEGQELQPNQYVSRGNILQPITLDEQLARDQAKNQFANTNFLNRQNAQLEMMSKKEDIKLAAKEKKDIQKRTKDFSEADRLLNQIQQDASKISGKLGPVAGKFESLKAMVGKGDPEFIKVRTKMGANLAEVIHRLSGSAASEAEVKRIQGFTPTTDDNVESLNAKIQGIKEYMAAKSGLQSPPQQTQAQQIDPAIQAKEQRRQELLRKAQGQ